MNIHIFSRGEEEKEEEPFTCLSFSVFKIEKKGMHSRTRKSVFSQPLFFSS